MTVEEAAKFLARADEITVGGLLQTVVLGLLRHYPLDIDLDVSAAALPGIWAAPKLRRAGSTAAPERQTRIPDRCDTDEIRHPGADDDQTACGS
jgi:hypothetical protein